MTWPAPDISPGAPWIAMSGSAPEFTGTRPTCWGRPHRRRRPCAGAACRRSARSRARRSRPAGDDRRRCGRRVRRALAGAGLVQPAGQRGPLRPAIAAAHLPRLFDRFYRTEPSRTGAQDHHGLGLARQHGHGAALGLVDAKFGFQRRRALVRSSIQRWLPSIRSAPSISALTPRPAAAVNCAAGPGGRQGHRDHA